MHGKRLEVELRSRVAERIDERVGRNVADELRGLGVRQALERGAYPAAQRVADEAARSGGWTWQRVPSARSVRASKGRDFRSG